MALSNGKETKQLAFRSIEPQTDTNADFVATIGNDGTIAKIDPVNLPFAYKTTIAAIRSYSGPVTNALVAIYTIDKGQEGFWSYDPSDTTSTDNTGTVLVTADGKRIKRSYTGGVSVKWFGAKGDSTTDDTTAFQNAINTGLDVYSKPDETYLISPLTQSTANQNFDFTGSILKLKAASSSAIITLSGAYSTITGGFFDGNKSAGQSGSNYNHAAVYLNANNCQVQNIISTNSYGIAIKGGTVDNIKISNCLIKDFSIQGIFVEGLGRDCVGNKILNNIVYVAANTGSGIYLKGENSPFTYKQKLWQVSGNIVFGPSSGTAATDICITIRGIDGICSNNTTYFGEMGISLDITSESVISNNKIETPNGGTGYCLEVNAGGNSIIGNILKGGIVGIISSGNTFSEDGNTISGNRFENQSGNTIAIQPGVSVTARNTLISGNNIIRNTNNPSIVLTRDCKYSIISENIISGNGSAVSSNVGIYLDSVNSDVSVLNNKFLNLQCAFSLYNTTATAYTNINFNGNDTSTNVTTQVRTEGTATFGSNIIQLNNTSISGKYTTQYYDRGNNIFFRYSNAGTPEGSLTAGIGSFIIRDLGGSGSTFYVKESGTGNTGWKAIGASDPLKADLVSPALTGIPTAPTASLGTNTTQLATTAFVKAATDALGILPKKYTALITQSSTGAPTVVVLDNTLGGGISWTRTGTGTYVGTLTGVFTNNKTVCTFNNTIFGSVTIQQTSVNTIVITTGDLTGTLLDNRLTNNTIKIEVYP